MNNEIIPPSSAFTRALERTQAARRAGKTEEPQEPRPSKSPRARLNFIPDDTMLGDMIDRALMAISRGAKWARGSILNLLV